MIPRGWLPGRSRAAALLLCAAAIAGVLLVAIPVLHRTSPPPPSAGTHGTVVPAGQRVEPPESTGSKPEAGSPAVALAATPAARPKPARAAARGQARGQIGVSAEVAPRDSSRIPHGSRAKIAARARVVQLPDRPAAADPGWYEELVVEVRAERMASTTVPAYWRDGVLLVPASDVFDLAEIRLQAGAGAEVRAVLEPEQIEVRIDPRSGRAWKDGREIPSEKAIYNSAAGRLYISAGLIEELLGVGTWFDLTSLTLLLDPVDHLPLGRRMAREHARQILLAGKQSPSPDQAFGRAAGALGGAAVDWSVNVPDYEDAQNTRVGLALGASVLSGALNVSVRSASEKQSWLSEEHVSGSWVGAWPEGRWVRQLRLGTIQGTGPRPRSLQGVAVGNSPFMRPLAFGQSELSGWLEPNWEVELYRDGALADFARADERGYFSLETTVDYGSNPVEVRAYGPNGEMRLISRALPVAPDRLPAGRFEYKLSAGRCPTNSLGCRESYNFDLHYGVNRSWTARTGAEFIRRGNAGDLLHPYGIVSGAVGPHVSVRAEAVARAVAGIQLNHMPSTNFRAQLSHSAFATNVSKPVLTPANALSRTWADLLWRPLAKKPAFFLSAHGAGNRNRDGWQLRGRLQLTTEVRRVRWTLSWQEEREERTTWTRSATILGLSGSTSVSPAPLHMLHDLYIRGDVAMEARGGNLERCALTMGKSIGGRVRLEAGATWIGPDGDARLMLGLSTSGEISRTHHRVVHTEAGGYQGSSYLDGSFVWNEAVGRLEPFPYQSSLRGGVSGWAFIDSNSNGWRDPGEEAVEGLQLRAGDKQAETDAAGRYSLWNMTPFEAAQLELVPGSLRNPLLVPQFNLASVHVGPNGFREVDVPLVPGTEVLGRVKTEDGIGQIAIGGLAITLRNLSSGRRFDATVFQDGQFYFMALPPGEYEVLLDEAALLRLGLQPTRASRHCVVPLATGRSQAFALTIDLVRAAKAALGDMRAAVEGKCAGRVDETDLRSPPHPMDENARGPLIPRDDGAPLRRASAVRSPARPS